MLVRAAHRRLLRDCHRAWRGGAAETRRRVMQTQRVVMARRERPARRTQRVRVRAARDQTSDVRIYPAWTATAPCSCNANADYGDQWPATCDPLFEHIESALPDYEKAVDQFLAGPFAKDHIDALIDRWSAQIRPHVMETAGLNAAPSEADWDQAVADLRQVIEGARAHRGLTY